MNLYQKQYYEKNKELIRRKHILYGQKHKVEIAERKRKFYLEHIEEIRQKAKIYRKNNREKRLKYDIMYQAKKMLNDPEFKLKRLLRSRIRQAVKKNKRNGSAVKDLGCSVDYLKQYIESKFYANMTWDNWGKVWQLDHIKELHTFDLKYPIQFKQAIHYTNLQPLTVEDHKIKTSNGNLNESVA